MHGGLAGQVIGGPNSAASLASHRPGAPLPAATRRAKILRKCIKGTQFLSASAGDDVVTLVPLHSWDEGIHLEDNAFAGRTGNVLPWRESAQMPEALRPPTSLAIRVSLVRLAVAAADRHWLLPEWIPHTELIMT